METRNVVKSGLRVSLVGLGCNNFGHWPDLLTPMEETLRALDDLVRQGKVRYIGCSNVAASAWRLTDAERTEVDAIDAA